MTTIGVRIGWCRTLKCHLNLVCVRPPEAEAFSLAEAAECGEDVKRLKSVSFY